MNQQSGDTQVCYLVKTRIKGREPLRNWMASTMEEAQRAKKAQEVTMAFYPGGWSVVIEEVPCRPKASLLGLSWKAIVSLLYI
jgi:hypothetical protein